MAQVLGNQVADGHAFAGLLVVGIDDFLEKCKQIAFLEDAGQKPHGDGVVDGIEVFADVEFEMPRVFAGKGLGSLERPAVALAFSTGVGVEDGVEEKPMPKPSRRSSNPATNVGMGTSFCPSN